MNIQAINNAKNITYKANINTKPQQSIETFEENENKLLSTLDALTALSIGLYKLYSSSDTDLIDEEDDKIDIYGSCEDYLKSHFGEICTTVLEEEDEFTGEIEDILENGEKTNSTFIDGRLMSFEKDGCISEYFYQEDKIKPYKIIQSDSDGLRCIVYDKNQSNNKNIIMPNCRYKAEPFNPIGLV